jgi:hypothetical protein
VRSEQEITLMWYRRVQVAGIAAAVLTVTCFAAKAQTGLPYGWRHGMMGTGLEFNCPPHMARLADWRIRRIEWAVLPTDAQRAALNELRAASAKAADTIAATCPTQIPEKAIERFALMEKRVEAIQQAMKIVRPAFEAFYTVLDDAQKARFDAAAPRRRDWRWYWPLG